MVNYNGDLLPESSHFLNHQNRGVRFGDALSERIRYTGRGLLFWEDHYFRLMAAMRQLRMEIPMNFTLEFLEAEIQKTLVASGHQNAPALIEIQIVRKGGAHLLPVTQEVSYIIETEALETAKFTIGGSPFVADLFRDYYIQADALSRLPHHNKITHVLASIFASENDLHTCLLLNHRKEMAEGLHGNLFLRKGKQIKTPPLDSGGSAGILRGFLLKQGLAEDGFELVEDKISPFELQQADELFLLDIVHGVQPISRYRKASFTPEAATRVTEILNEMIPVES
ncbi:MAG: aminotransferase class IV [Robiginitalea sp.]